MATADESHLVYFLHIPKTAGTSLHAFLARGIGPGRVLPPLLWDHLTDGRVTVEEDTRLISGHFGGLFPLWRRRWPRIVTVLRDPIARALSHIHHVQRHDVHPLHPVAAGLSVGDYCRHPVLRSTVDNVQSRHLASLSFALALLPREGEGRPWSATQLAFEEALLALDSTAGLREAACRALDAIDVVGLAEEFNRSLRLFARALGYVGEILEPRLNSTPEGQKAARLSDGDLQALAQMTAIDSDVYRHARTRFTSQCDRLGIAPGPDMRAA